MLQGSIRENLDPLGLHTDRDMMSLLKDVGLWDILAGLSLSRFKAAGQPIPASIPYASSAASSLPIGLTPHHLCAPVFCPSVPVLYCPAEQHAGRRTIALLMCGL